MKQPMRTSRSPLAFFVLVFVLFIPFWVAGALTTLQLLPALPVSALGAFCPAVGAAILLYRENGLEGIVDLSKRSFDVGRVKAKVWYLPAILLIPCIMALSYAVLRLMEVPVPPPEFSLTMAIALFVAFFVAALGEELGWSGYAIDRLQDRFGPLWAALLLGAAWAAYHFIPLLEAGQSLLFIGWWSLGTVAARVIMTWLYNSTGRSVFVATVFHTMINLTWQLFPVQGSYYDPRATGAITAAVAVIVVILWRPWSAVRNVAARG